MAFETGAPKALFQTRGADLTDTRNQNPVAGNGQRFLFNLVKSHRGGDPIIIVLHGTAAQKH